MKKRGFLLGKFLPPHAGHLFMCRTAQALCDEMTVLFAPLIVNRSTAPIWLDEEAAPQRQGLSISLKDVPGGTQIILISAWESLVQYR
ncbi:MAG: adenylyltransferase/cytidyltransferase family protein [Nitratireductor sp.]